MENIQGGIENKLVDEIMVLINLQKYPVPKLCGGEFYAKLRKSLNEAKNKY